MKILSYRIHGLDDALENAGLPFESGKPRIKTITALANSEIRSHAKFMRQIMVAMKVEASRAWWTEFDTYKIGVVSMSTSTMHTLLNKKLTLDDFVIPENIGNSGLDYEIKEQIKRTIEKIELIKKEYKDEDKTHILMAIKYILPESFKRTSYVTLNYESLRTIYNDRKSHRLNEWQVFLKSVEEITPLFKELISGDI